tara:strand:- start:495 stop:941 length:447 start_codon:yes stop_codon:yes gene_type:complete
MAKRITEGSLVCTKRKIEGMGIVLKRVKNINEYAEFDLSGAFADLFDRQSRGYESSYSNRQKIIREINAKIIEKKPEVELPLLEEFWSHNRVYSHHLHPKKRKKLLQAKIDFCLVNWTKAPSDYDGRPARKLQRKNVWMLSSGIRNKT